MGALTDVSISAHSPNHHNSIKYIDGSRHRYPHLISTELLCLQRDPPLPLLTRQRGVGCPCAFRRVTLQPGWGGKVSGGSVPSCLTLKRPFQPLGIPGRTHISSSFSLLLHSLIPCTPFFSGHSARFWADLSPICPWPLTAGQLL